MERGPVGRRVAENVRRLREERRLSLDELAAQLAELGRPIIPSSLSKLERGMRRVDVDDLEALGRALDVIPADLLLPAGQTYGDQDVRFSEIEQNLDALLPLMRAARHALDEGVDPRIVLGSVRVANSRMASMWLLHRVQKSVDGER